MPNTELITQYADDVRQQFLTGHAREHAYRPALERLMGSFEDITAVNDPKRSQHGNPDFVFVKRSNNNITFGYAEAKDITIDLAKTVKTEQLRRYAGYEKLFLTNYIDFKFFRNGEEYEQVSIGQLKNNELVFDQAAFGRLEDVLQEFVNQRPETIRSGKRLALIMGGKARRIRDNVQIYLSHEDDARNQELEKIFKMMKELLVHDLSVEKFADMYAQTLVYGLFVARYNDKTPKTFTRGEARDLVPASNPFLREFFDHIVGPHFDNRLANIVDELCAVFEVSDVHKIVQKHLRLFEVENDKDPIIHFYEDFLKEYDPAERKKMGAYYTPIPVVKFIIRSVDEILKRDFDLSKGLADTSRKPVVLTSQGTKTKTELHKVQILDPAVGTATFLNETIKYIYKGFKGQEGRWPAYVESDLLPRLYGFELMMAPYTIAHLKLGMTLQDTGVEQYRHRLGVYLTNTLEEGQKRQIDLFMQFGLAEVVSQEANAATKIKHERPIMVIIGNPPYSGESSNKTEYATSLVSKYKYEPGGVAKLKERNPKWINDDYVKFIAFAEDLVTKNGEGIVAMITNHSYLDNPTFRGMRWHLVNTFDSIHILDLHGNAKKKESAADGSKDENVFAIQQGVSIILAVKTGKKRKGQPAKVYHSEIYGKRREKFDRLDSYEQNWTELKLDPSMFYFANKNIEGKSQYEKGLKISELFIVSSVGLVTSADKTLIDQSKDELLKKLTQAKEFDGQGKVHDRLQDKEIEPDYVKRVSYRPFDDQYIYYDTKVIERARENVMQHFLQGKNLGLMVCRQQKTEGFYHALVHEHIVESSYVSNRTSEIGSTFPLYVYHDDGTRTTNFKTEVLNHFMKNVQSPFEPEDVIDYIYASLYSPQYRSIYKEFLKADFPRVPAPKNDAEFHRLSILGKELRELHLMISNSANDFITTFPEPGSNEIYKITYNDNRVWINSTQFFGGVPETVWHSYIGAYQPAQKWLKDRAGHKLSNEDIEQYQRIIKVLAETYEIMHKIDAK